MDADLNYERLSKAVTKREARCSHQHGPGLHMAPGIGIHADGGADVDEYEDFRQYRQHLEEGGRAIPSIARNIWPHIVSTHLEHTLIVSRGSRCNISILQRTTQLRFTKVALRMTDISTFVPLIYLVEILYFVS